MWHLLGELTEDVIYDTGDGSNQGGGLVINAFDPLTPPHVCPTGMEWTGEKCEVVYYITDPVNPGPRPHLPPRGVPDRALGPPGTANSIGAWLQTKTEILGIPIPNFALLGGAVVTAIILSKGKR